MKTANHTTLSLCKPSHSMYIPHKGVGREPQVGRDAVKDEGKLSSEWGTITKGADTTDLSPNLKEDPRPHFIPHV